MKEEELIDIFQIVGRANNMGTMLFDRISLRMDLGVAHQELNLQLKVSLNSDDVNFAHDAIGIQNCIDRKNKRIDDEFLPKYSSLQFGEKSKGVCHY